MKKVLVVDDSKLWREYLKEFLEEEGYTVDTAEDGISAVNKFFEFLPDVVITDYVMPGMNGIHLCRFIRGYSSFEKVGIAVLTGLEEDVNEFWVKRSGANAFLKKGVEKEELERQILQFLQKDYYAGWSREVYKLRREPFGELVDILEETLRVETLNREILGFITHVEDEEYTVTRLAELVRQFSDYTSIHTLLLSPSRGRIYSLSKDKVFAPDYVRELLLEEMKRPLTPGQWMFKGQFKGDANSTISGQRETFVISRNREEFGVILIEEPRNVSELYKFFEITGYSLSTLFNSLNRVTESRVVVEYDNLTKIYNRAAVLKRLREMMALSARKNLPLCIAMIDMDDFKKINDTYGHVVGDKVLEALGEMFQKALRESDVVGRYGGEEFLVAFPASTPEESKEALERILQELRRVDWRSLTGYSFSVTFSAGIACFRKNESVTEFIQRADRALYAAKSAGKNRVLTEVEK